MKTKTLFCLLLTFSMISFRPTAADSASTPLVRIGVDIRVSYQSFVEFWTPLTEHLSNRLPGYRFVVVPIASRRDLLRLLENKELDFVSLDPALELLAEDRFGVAPLATIVETLEGEGKPRPAGEACNGVVIRRADKKDIQRIEDIRGRTIAAVRPWSLTGWISQWGLLVKHGVDPQKDVKQVTFLGTHGDVVKSVLDGTADIGILDADVLFCLGRLSQIPPGALAAFNQQGVAVPLQNNEFIASTPAYPGRFFAKTTTTSDDLAKRVSNVLLNQSLMSVIGGGRGVPCNVRWATPCNTSEVRRLLHKLIGLNFIDSPGYPPEQIRSVWLYPAFASVGMIAIAAFLLFMMRDRYVHQTDMLEDQLQTTQRELAEVRAEQQQINTILSLAGCGIDIVDDHNDMVYADAGLERKFGDWRGKKCHSYYCKSDTPCPGCRMPSPADELRQTVWDIDGTDMSSIDDPHARVHVIEGEATRMISIPFRDESGRWLYARLHLPFAAIPDSKEYNRVYSETTP